VCRNSDSANTDGEGRQGQVVSRRRRGAQSRDGEGRPCSEIDESATHYTTRRRNAHGIAEYELLYPWHPWAGCLVHIHEVVEKAGREVFRCSLSGQASGRWLEIPAWMFDRAACAAWRVGAAPYVEIAVLTALRHEAPPPNPPLAPLTQYKAF
jgi:hypothetical protein